MHAHAHIGIHKTLFIRFHRICKIAANMQLNLMIINTYVGTKHIIVCTLLKKINSLQLMKH